MTITRQGRSAPGEGAAADSVLAGVLAATEEGVLVLDGTERITDANQAAQRLLGYGHGELVGLRLCGNVSCAGEDRACEPGACDLLESRPASPVPYRREDQFVGRSGARVPVAIATMPIGDAAWPLGHVMVFRDISERHASEESERRELEEVSWIGRLREAMDEDRLVLAAQPIISLATGEVVRHELLVRLRDRDGGLVMPVEFLAAAERFGLVGRLDRWVVRRAARMTAGGQAVSINMSAHSLRSPELASLIEGVLREEDADPTLLMFEVTELALTERPRQARRFLERMHALGCELAVDDLGVCDGAFDYLEDLPVGYLKIDRGHFASPDATTSRHLVAAIVSLAERLGRRTIAEGIENLATLEFVRELGVDYGQGYYIAPPGGSPRASNILRPDAEGDRGGSARGREQSWGAHARTSPARRAARSRRRG